MTVIDNTIDQECSYLDACLKKIFFVRSETFMDHVVSVLREKDKEIFDLRKEISKLSIVKKENEILQMKVGHLEEDQEILKEKIRRHKKSKELMVQIEEGIVELTQRLGDQREALAESEETRESITETLAKDRKRVNALSRQAEELLEKMRFMNK